MIDRVHRKYTARETVHPRKTEVTHKDVCKAVASISAYLRVGNREKAREYARKLIGYLEKMDLLPTNEDTSEEWKNAPY